MPLEGTILEDPQVARQASRKANDKGQWEKTKRTKARKKFNCMWTSTSQSAPRVAEPTGKGVEMEWDRPRPRAVQLHLQLREEVFVRRKLDQGSTRS